MNEKKKSKKKIVIIIISILIVITILAGVFFYLENNKNKTKNNTSKETTNEVKESAYRLSGNSLENFDLHFLQLENEKANKIYSPLSIKYALAMLNEGADGHTKAQIESLIGDYKGKKYTNSANMSFANAIFIRNSFKDSVKEKYTNNLKDKYNAEVIYDSFNSPDNINNWVSNKTFNLINNLFDDVSGQDFVLVNALAIDMEWNKFIQATTETYKNQYNVSYQHENFSSYVPLIQDDNYSVIDFDNNTKKAKTVEIGAAINNYDIINTLGEENIRNTVKAEYEKWLASGGCGGNEEDPDTYVNKYINELASNYKKYEASTDFTFYDDENIKVFAKDLKEYNDTTLQYIGIMPKNISLDNYIENTDATEINNIINNLKEIKPENFKEGVITKIVGNIPLFKFDYELDLVNDLKELGITDVFDSNKADLSGITDNKGAAINKATHKANIEFSNEGIKAAAVSTLGGFGGAGCGFVYNYDVPVETIDLTFNNPYLFLIRDKNTGEVWFVGTVYEPLSE